MTVDNEKGFWTVGKILGVGIAAIVLLFGGCYGVTLVLSGAGAVAPHEEGYPE